MAEAAVATTKSPKKATKAKKAQPKATHPPFKSMVTAAVKSLKERTGSSRQAILKYILANYKVGDEKKAGRSVRVALKKAVSSGSLRQVKGSGASGSFRLAKDDFGTGKRGRPTTGKKSKKATTPKKPAAKKVSKVKKTPVKKAQPKKTKVTAKSPPKKPAAKKTTKKPAAKKSPKKVAKK